MDLRLRGRRALVTGASKGIGRAIAHGLACEGVDLILVARSSDGLEETAAAITAVAQVEIDLRPMDVGDGTAVEALARSCANVDILVNNAGAIPGGTLDEVDEQTWRRAWDLKVFGYINMTRAFYAAMRERRRGVIINIIGAAGERLDAGYIAGSTGNAALMAFTRALGGASSRDGIRVLGINPGPVLTERLIAGMKAAAKRRFGDEAEWEKLLQAMPFGRAALPEEIAAMTMLTASDLSAYVSGTVITMDGGGATPA